MKMSEICWTSLEIFRWRSKRTFSKWKEQGSTLATIITKRERQRSWLLWNAPRWVLAICDYYWNIVKLGHGVLNVRLLCTVRERNQKVKAISCFSAIKTGLFIIMLNATTIILLNLAKFWPILRPCLLISGDISSDFAGWLLIILPF